VRFFCDGYYQKWLRRDDGGRGVSFVKKARLGDGEIGIRRRVRISLRGPKGWGEYPTPLVHIRFSS